MHKTLKYILKYLPWVVIIAGTIIAFQVFNCQSKNNSRLDTYNRQLQGQLTTKEAELQTANNKIGVSNSKLLKQSELANQLKKDNEEIDQKFNEFRKKHDLQIKSRDRTIASLKQKVTGGKTEVTINDSCTDISKRCIIGYNWQDGFRRFKLVDPNIFEPGDEVFEKQTVIQSVWRDMGTKRRVPTNTQVGFARGNRGHKWPSYTNS